MFAVGIYPPSFPADWSGESFFSPLQNNAPDRQRWNTQEELRIIVTWIERTYHRRRRQAGLGRLTPIEFEAIMTPPADQSA